jgi:hypothetical protein
MPPLRLLPLLLLLAAAAAALDPPTPTPWPEQFHAVVFTNLTGSGGRLQLIDLYYDWPRGRNLNLIRGQLSGDPTYDVEWTNGTSYFFNATSCRTKLFPVGLLPPDWLAAGAVYLGRETVAGFDCHLWTKVDFVWYYEDVVTHRPVRWNFFNGNTTYYLPTCTNLHISFLIFRVAVILVLHFSLSSFLVWHCDCSYCLAVNF